MSATRSEAQAPVADRDLSPETGAKPTHVPTHADSFRPELQGLRAIAVGLVVLFHFWPRRLSGGYVGVDVFFVISGYLITSHIFREVAQTGHLRVGRFWARRIRRLLPASLLVLVLSAVGVLLWAPATVWTQSARQIAASALYVQNWALAVDAVDYMALDNVPTVAQHYWSLSVEEQFYAVWPLLIVGVLALVGRTASVDRRRRAVMTGLAVLGAASLVWSGVSTAHDQAFAYMSTFTRVWEFAGGALTALVAVRLSGWKATALGWVGVAAVLWSSWAFTERSAFPGWIALVPVLGAIAIIVAGRGRGPGTAGWWLSLRPARFIGDISYSIYLIHWPLVVLAPYALGHKLAWPEKLVLLALTVVLAWLSKTFVEDPLRVRPLLAAAPWRAFAFAAAGMVAVVAVHAGIDAEVGHRERVAAQSAQEQLASARRCLGPAALDPSERCSPIHGSGPLVAPPEVVAQQGKLPIYSRCQQSLGSPELKACDLGQTQNPTRTVALLGDSHAGALTPLFDQLGKDLGWKVVAATKGSCPSTEARRVLPNESSDERQVSCEAFNATVVDRIAKDPSISAVFVTAFSSAYTWDNAPGGHLRDPAVEGFQQMWQRWLRAGKTVYVIRDVPGTGKRSIPSCLAQNADRRERCDLAREKALPGDVEAEAARAMKNPRVSLVDLTDRFCDRTTCYGSVGNVIVYHDTSHLSREYATLLAPVLESRLGRLAKAG